MSGIGTGYDLSAMTYSPEGRVFQIEYAAKAVENSGTAIALRVKDGVVFAVEKLLVSQLLEPGSGRRISAVDKHIGMATAGLMADCRNLVNRARAEADNYRSSYRSDIPVRVLADRISLYMQAHTIYGSVRPFGASVLIGGMDNKGPQLYVVEPSGLCFGYFGGAAGKAATAAKTEIEKLQLSNMTVRSAVVEAAKIIYRVHDEVKDKLFELELGWISEETGRRFQLVPKDVFEEAEKAAIESKTAQDEMLEDEPVE